MIKQENKKFTKGSIIRKVSKYNERNDNKDKNENNKEDSEGKDYTEYKIGDYLGKGGFGKCYEFIRSDGKVFAGKVVSKENLVKSRQKKKIQEEIKIHRELIHKNIVKFNDYFEDKEDVYIILEVCTNKSLDIILKNNENKILPEYKVKKYMSELINALQYIHEHHVVHRDLKPGNLFLNDNDEIKVGDFGLAKKLVNKERTNTVCGTPHFMAPEIINNKKKGYSYEVDIWSFGVILYQLLIGYNPFYTRDTKQTFALIEKNKITFPKSPKINREAKDLIMKILISEPSKRLTLEEIKSHEFFQRNRMVLHRSNKNLILRLDFEKKRIERKQTLEKENKLKKINLSIRVEKWVDYGTKYGLGYLLTNKTHGVVFNDNSKIILKPLSNKFIYIDNEENLKEYNKTDYPGEIHDKITLFNNFILYLKGRIPINNLESFENKNIQEFEENFNEKKGKDKELIYVKRWMRTKDAIFFRLTNSLVQVCLQDHTEIILSSNISKAIYINQNSQEINFNRNTILNEGEEDIKDKYKYIKEVLEKLQGS